MATPAKIVTMSITTSNSRRVNPPRALCGRGPLPVGDAIRRTLDPVRASREEVIVFAVVLPGGPVDVGFPPRIKRHGLLEVRSLPVGGARGRGPQGCQSLSGGRISSVVHLEQIERRAQIGVDIGPRYGFLRLLALPRQARSHHGHQDADDDDRQHQFDQGEPAGVPQDFCRDLHACLPHVETQRAKRSIWKIGNIMEITMNPTTAPTIRIITGSTSDVIDLIRRSASRSYVSAILNSERSNAPDSSPTAIMWVTGVGKRRPRRDRKSTRLNSSHGYISYAVFCLKKKKNKNS